MEYAPNVVK